MNVDLIENIPYNASLSILFALPLELPTAPSTLSLSSLTTLFLRSALSFFTLAPALHSLSLLSTLTLFLRSTL